jgi:hypothetical protein
MDQQVSLNSSPSCHQLILNYFAIIYIFGLCKLGLNLAMEKITAFSGETGSGTSRYARLKPLPVLTVVNITMNCLK